MKHLLYLLITLLSATCLHAQVVQSGVVYAYDGKRQVPLEGVTIMVRNASTVVTDQNGRFQLEFMTKKPGTRIGVVSVQKAGYEVFNANSLNYWLLSRNDSHPFTILMSPVDSMKSIRDNYMCYVSDTYRHQHILYQQAIAQNHIDKHQKICQMKDSIQWQKRFHTRQLKNINSYISHRDWLTNPKAEALRVDQVRQKKQEVVDIARRSLLDKILPYTTSEDPSLIQKADSLYQFLYKRYSYDNRLRQQWADHLIATSSMNGQRDLLRLARSTEPLVGIVTNKKSTEEDEIRARLTLTNTLIDLEQYKASHDQLLEFIYRLPPICQSDSNFYLELRQRLDIPLQHCDYLNPHLPILFRFSERYIENGQWDYGINLLNDVYNKTTNKEARQTISDRLAYWGLLPDKQLNISNE